MEKYSVLDYVLVMCIIEGVEKMYKNAPVRGTDISTTELITLHTTLYMKVLAARIKRKPLVEIEKMYIEEMQFINSLITRV